MVARLKVSRTVFLAAGLLFMTCGKAGGGALQNDPGTILETAPASETVTTPDTVSSGSLQLFDAHAHQMPATYPAGWLESLFAEHDPSGISLLGIGNVLAHQMNYPTKVFAFSYFKVNELVLNSTVVLSDLDTDLSNGTHGIGEVSIHHFSAGGNPKKEYKFDESELIDVYERAKLNGVPVTFHYDYHDYDDDQDHHDDFESELGSTLPGYIDASGNPEVNFIWAHAGDAQPDELRPLLAKFDNLHIDISSRNPLESFEGRQVYAAYTKELQRLDEEDGTIKDSWKELFTDYADRVLYGSDIGPQGRLAQYGEIQEYYRGILAQLDPEVAEKIAYKNAQSLFLDLVVKGDINNDGDVDGEDFLIWQRNDGTSEGLTNLLNNYGTVTEPLTGASQVPEPSTLSLCTLAAFALWPASRQRV